MIRARHPHNFAQSAYHPPTSCDFSPYRTLPPSIIFFLTNAASSRFETHTSCFVIKILDGGKLVPVWGESCRMRDGYADMPRIMWDGGLIIGDSESFHGFHRLGHSPGVTRRGCWRRRHNFRSSEAGDCSSKTTLIAFPKKIEETHQ